VTPPQAVAEGSAELRSQWRQMQDVSKVTPETDPIKQLLDEFLAGSSVGYESASERAKECEASAARVVKYYGAEKSMTGEDVVSAFRSFVRACRAVHDAIDVEAAAAAAAAAAADLTSTTFVSTSQKSDSQLSKPKSFAKKTITSPPKLAVSPTTLLTQPPAAHPEIPSSIDVFEIPDVTPRPLVFDIPEFNSLHPSPAIPPLSSSTNYPAAPQPAAALVVRAVRLAPRMRINTLQDPVATNTGVWLQVRSRDVRAFAS
jgi:hypothetical protein